MNETRLKEINIEYNKAFKSGDLNEALKQAKLKLLHINDDPTELKIVFTNKMISDYDKKHVRTGKALDNAQKEGWDVLKKNKASWSLHRNKVPSIGFEQKCWAIFSKMKFHYLNNIQFNDRKELSFKIPFKLANGSLDHKQIDIFAANDEVIIVGECKSSESSIPKKADHKGLVKVWNEDLNSIRASVGKMFGRDRKVSFIWMTNNYKYGDATIKRLVDKEWNHFNQDTIKYFVTLANDLGEAAGYQLIGKLFSGKKIPNMKNRFPAIKDKIGGHECYVFSCTPDILLKIGYVVHQTDKTSDTDAFQRLVKKGRLNKIRTFVHEGGFFPNSIIINIKGKKKTFNGWKQSEKQNHDSKSDLGVIELPQVYRSAFIIDGQHRLYGYTQQDGNVENYNAVPVVMFYNLKTTEQTQIFEQINSTQKSPPASLIDIIKSDLNWDSDNQYDMVQALKSRIFIALSKDTNSPFYDKIIVGEEPTTDNRCLSLNTIKNQGMGVKTQYFGSFLSNGDLDTPGFLWRKNKDDMLDNAVLFLKCVFLHIENHYPEQWNLGRMENGLLSMNIGIVCFLKLFEQIIVFEINNNGLEPRKMSGDKLAEIMYPYLDIVIKDFKTFDKQKIKNFRVGSRGSSGYKQILGAFLSSINHSDDKFNHPLIKTYRDAESGIYNEPANKLVEKIEKCLFEMVEKKFTKEYGKDWWDKEISANTKIKCNKRRNLQDEEYKNKGKEPLRLPFHHYLDPLDYMDIISHKRELFSSNADNGNNHDLFYVCPNDLESKQGYKKKIKWLEDFNIARQQASHIGSRGPVTADAFRDLEDIEAWFSDKYEAFMKNIKSYSRLV